MRQIERKQVDRDVVVDVICDRCGGSCLHKVDAEIRQVEAATFSADWGYFSNHDLEQWHADLCEGCAEEVKAFIDAGAGGGVQLNHYA